MNLINIEKGTGMHVLQVASLKKQCLDQITDNFEIYNSAFILSKDATLYRNLQFLQRKYSAQIILELSNKDLLDDRHLDFVINEHLKELDLQLHLKNGCTFQGIESRIAEVGHAFTKVIVDNLHFDHSVIDDIICHLPNVEVLHVLWNCHNITLENISISCPKLRELNVNNSSEVTNEGVEKLCKKDGGREGCSLKVLSLIDTSVTYTGIIYLLENMPSLEIICFADMPFILFSIHEENFKNNTLSTVKKYNLKSLYLLLPLSLELKNSCSVRVLNVLKVWTVLCPNVSTLAITIWDEKYLDTIILFSKLEHLTLKQMFDCRPNINNLLKSTGSKLQTLEIESFQFSISVLIENCLKLKKLVFRNSVFEPLENTKLICLKNLSELVLDEISFGFPNTEDSIDCILQSTSKLEKLSMHRCIFKNSEMNTKFAKYCERGNIQHLTFYDCDIDLPLLESIILACSSLKTLAIRSCKNIKPNEAYNLQQLKNTAKSFVEIEYIENYHDNDSDDSDFNTTDSDDSDFDYRYYDYNDYDSSDCDYSDYNIF